MTAHTNRLVAIIESDNTHRRQLDKALMSYYDLRTWGDGASALLDLEETPPALIVMSGHIAPNGALDFLRAVRNSEKLHQIPVLLITDSTMKPGLADELKRAGVTATFAKPYKRSTIVQAISKQLNASIEHRWEALPETPKTALKKSVAVFNDIADVLMTGETVSFADVQDNCEPLVEAIENNDFKSILNGVRDHDDYTYAHSMRVATLLSLLGNAAGFSHKEQLMLASGGLLHDVGKMMIPHNILNKPGKLTDEEFEVMKSHVPETIEYLEASGGIPKAVMIIAEQHHEKIDGTGYPHGLQGKELNELARMAAVVDVFSALTDRRVYKPPMAEEKAIGIMREEMTNHLDQRYVEMFRGILGDSDIL